MNTFLINYHNNSIQVHQQDESNFIIDRPQQQLHLILKEDNEGAFHWFEKNADNETEITKEIGTLIEIHSKTNNLQIGV
jgi:hypothetical protein